MANLGIDLDDVLCDFMSKFADICRAKFNRPAIGELPVDWEWSNFGLSKEQINEAWKEQAKTFLFWENLGLEAGVDPEKVRELDKDHNLFFITARVPSRGGRTKDQSCNWLKDNLHIDNPTVFVTTNKGPLAAALQLDYFIDDRPKNCLEIKAAVPNCTVFLKDSSHNQTFSQEGIFRVKDFNEFADIVLYHSSPLFR